jgi:MYXO-CTERM domain-containing protein
VPSQPQDVFQLPQPAPGETQTPAQVPPQAAPPPADTPEPAEVTPLWYYLVPAAALAALGGILFLRRRRRGDARAEAMAAAALIDNPPPPPRPEPVPRPWLELELKAERAAWADPEASVEFEMVIRNTGKSAARNVRVNARMFNAGREQDQEIGAFFKTKGEGRRTHVIGELPPGESGLIQGAVSMSREEMKALQVNEQLLFVPVVGVNLVYDWGNGRTGQTSKSYVIGRELGEETEKMGAFRLDLGPRVYRTVGQRQHSLAKRV